MEPAYHRLPRPARDVSAPALVIHGDNDTSVPVAAARAAADLMPDVRLEVVEGAAHWVQRDRPDVVVPMMLEFLDTLNAEA